MAGKVFTHPSVTSYDTPGHPEASWRVSKTAERLRSTGHALLEPGRKATGEEVLRVHAKTHWEAVVSGTFQDADTPRYPNIHVTALTSLSGALSAMRAALGGDPAFSLMRPPGHHAGKERVAGFCYVNNLAIAVRDSLANQRARRVGILDIDVHHGDGTEDIFLGEPGVLFASLHQFPLYPGTGLRSRENCLNFPLASGTAEGVYLKTLETALTQLLDFKPDLLAVSAGFDTYKECPIANLLLEKATYRKIGRQIAQTGLKRFAVLEGGYAPDLPLLVESFLEGFFG